MPDDTKDKSSARHWLELSLIHNHPEWIEELFWGLGALAVTQRDAANQPLLEPAPGETPLWTQTRITGLFDEKTDIDAIKLKINRALDTDQDIAVNLLEDRNWVRAWMDGFTAMSFGQQLWIVPGDMPAPTDQDAVVLRLDPGLAFGTGTHPTTAMCLQYIDQHPPKNMQVLDYGCGSGVLGIAALLLGARHADALDIDAQALAATLDNAQRNRLDHRITAHLDDKQIKDKQYDLVLANILAGPLCDLAASLCSRIQPGGHIVLSGILQHQADSIINAYTPWLGDIQIQQSDDWVRIHGQRQSTH